ncbi:MAG TPA: molybdopterin biosynthesis protein [Pseudolabrys sp.]|nr:molybdopterin biosynthesis protein [Pseudolabrys sp.]
MSETRKPRRSGDSDLIARVRAAARQEQFLEVVSAEEARARFEKHLELKPLAAETVMLAGSRGRVLVQDVVAAVDAPPFDRSNVDGFAVRAADTVGAGDGNPKVLPLNPEVITCGHTSVETVAAGTCTAIATGGVIPRGADAVVMIEQTELIEEGKPRIELRRAALPGQFISYAGSDIARGETLLRRGTCIDAREIGMLAACGLDRVDVVRRPRVAVLSTGDELVEPGKPLPSAGVYDSNGAIIAASIAEAGGEPLVFGAFRDDAVALEKAVREAMDASDMVVLSGGTSKGAGDLSHRVVSRLGKPGILVHGVALKPGKPLCLGVIGNKPIVVLPGFPTSAIFTFHAFVAPVIRTWAGLPPETEKTIAAHVPVRIVSELGRKEFVLVSLIESEDATFAFPIGKGSGAVTSFSQADGFVEIDALSTVLNANSEARVTLLDKGKRTRDLVIMGSHDVALDIVVGALANRGFVARTLAVGSQGGVAAINRGECDIAPVHLIDPVTGHYNKHLVEPGLTLVPGWRRMQGVVFRSGDRRFEGRSAQEALKIVLADASALMVNRNVGAGTRVLMDRLLDGARPAGYANQPKSHNAVAAAIAQGRADWGLAIEPVAKLYGLGFLPVAPEHYDFLVADARRSHPAVQTFIDVLRDQETRERIRALGMQPTD